jgi:Tetratricopeptide repeat
MRTYGGLTCLPLSTGRFLHALGNVKATQGYLDDSFSYHQRALLQYRSTVGDNHHRTAAMCYKVADHYARLNQEEAAMQVLRRITTKNQADVGVSENYLIRL